MRDEAGNLTGFIKVIRDLTERKQLEEELRQSRTYLGLLIESLPQMVWTCRPDGEWIISVRSGCVTRGFRSRSSSNRVDQSTPSE